MPFDFGKNLLALRTGKGLTQEQAAELLNISKQSVSRWENGVTWPDVSFLPNLASFYGVTVDALLGAGEAEKQAALGEYASRRQAAQGAGDRTGALELSRAAFGKYPNESMVMSNLMIDAYLLGKEAEGPRGREALRLSLSTAERLSRMTDDLEERCRCIRYSALCHQLLGQPEEARRWMERLPGVWSGIELCAMELLEGKELREHLQSTLSDFTDILCKLLLAYAELPELSRDERSKVLQKLPELMKLLFEDGDYGLFLVPMTRAEEKLAELAEDPEERIRHETLARNCAERFCALTEGRHASLLFRGLPYSPEDFTGHLPAPGQSGET